MKSLCYALVLLFLPIAQAQHDHAHEPAVAKVELPAAKDQVEWTLFSQLDLKSKVAATELSSRLKKPLTLSGFAIPLDFDKKEVDQFLFVPFVPTCMHVPPPAENQIIFVKSKTKLKVADLMYPLQVSGDVELDLKQKNDAYFNMKAKSIKVAR